MIKTVLSGLVFVFVMFSGHFLVHAEVPTVDTHSLLNDMRLKVKTQGDRTTLVDTVVDGRDLFEASYAHELFKKYEKEYKTLDLIYDHLTIYESHCPNGIVMTDDDRKYLTKEKNTLTPVKITQKDIINILPLTRNGPAIVGLLESQRLIDSNLNKLSDESFHASCKWIQSCVQGATFRERENDKNPLERGDIQVCTSIVDDLYDRYSTQVGVQLEFDDNRDRDIYMNGIVEEDRGQFCDINKKLEDILGTISCSAEEFPSFSSFDPQKVPRQKDEDVQTPSEYNSAPEDAPDESGFGNINELIPSNGVPREDSEIEKNAEYLEDVGPAQDGLNQGNTARLISKPKEGGLSSLTRSLGTAKSDTVGGNNGSLQNAICEVQELAPEDQPVDFLREGNTLVDLQNEYLAELDTDQRLEEALDQGPDTSDLENEIIDIIDNASLGLLEEVKIEFTQCIQDYTQEDPETLWAQIKKHLTTTPDVMECLKKVLCKEYSDPSGLGIYRVRFCKIPSREHSTANTLPVMCISDTIDAHNAVIENMNNNGRMIKHVKSKEFLEFQVFGLEYSTRFAFSLNTNLKKPKKTVDERVEKELKIQQQDELRRIFLNEYTDSDVLKPFFDNPTLYNSEYEKATSLDVSNGDALNANARITQRIQSLEENSQHIQGVFDQLTNELQGEQNMHGAESIALLGDFREQVMGYYAELNKMTVAQEKIYEIAIYAHNLRYTHYK